MTLQNTTADKINSLHQEIEAALNKSLKNAIEIGRLLSHAKAEIPHGQFTGWLEENCTFSGRTARRYMKLFDNRDKIGSAEGIQEAYTLLQEPKTDRLSNFEEAEVVNSEIDEAFHIVTDYLWHRKVTKHPVFVKKTDWDFCLYLREISRGNKALSIYEKDNIREQLNSTQLSMDYFPNWTWFNRVIAEEYCCLVDYEDNYEEMVNGLAKELEPFFQKVEWPQEKKEEFPGWLAEQNYKLANTFCDAVLKISDHILNTVIA